LSWKSIDMQVALPRVQDAGKLQEQMMKQNQHFQETLAQSQLQLEEEKKRRVNAFEHIQAKRAGRDGENADSPTGDRNDDGPQKETAGDEPVHPYLGRHFDFNG